MTHHSSIGRPDLSLLAAGVGESVGRLVGAGDSVAVGSGVSVGRGVAVGVSVAVGIGVQVGTGVAVGSGVDVGGASRVNTALAVARAALTTAVASSQPGAVHCACADWATTRKDMNAATIHLMMCFSCVTTRAGCDRT